MRPEALALLATVRVAAAQTPPPPVFAAAVETVYVDAFVTQDGLPVLGLTDVDFELKDNGARQDIDLVAADSVPLLGVLAFDTSASVAGDKLRELRAAGEAFLAGLRAPDEAALLTFSQQVRWLAGPTRDKAAVAKALGLLEARGNTAVRDALYAAITLPLSQARTLVVLFSDGEDNASWLGPGQLEAVAERSNALVHVVGLRPGPAPPPPPGGRGGQAPDSDLEPPHARSLRLIAEATGGRYWQAESPARLTAAFAAISEAMSRRYVLRYEPKGPRLAGWHALELRLRGRKGQVHARRGYWLIPR